MPTDSQQPRNERLVIGITGRIGAGKTSAGEYLKSKHGFQYLRYSQVLADWRANNAGSQACLQDIGWEVMSTGVQNELNRRLIVQVGSEGDVVIDGLRHPIDFESLKSAFGPSFRLLYLDSPQEARWDRKRVKEKYGSLEAFRRADSHPVEQQIESLRTRAALVIRNEGSLEDFHAALDETVRGFRRAGRA
jgi:dephospho-CoA kinase